MKKTLTVLALIATTLAGPAFAEGQFTLTGDDVPRAIEVFYDEVVADPLGGGQNIDLIRQALAPDWETRPNPLNPVGGDGPGPEGLMTILQGWGTFMVDLKIERIRTIRQGNDVIVLSRFGATINPDLPAEIAEIPIFPGIPAADIKGRSFVSMALDIQVLNEDGLIHRTWHLEDWSSAQAQLLGQVPSVEFSLSEDYLD